MKTVVIKECESIEVKDTYSIDLSKKKISHCTGCWNCWWKTPGRCVHHDLDEFFHEYITADRAVYFAQVKKGFVSGNMKTLFDRMIPLYLPYTTYKTGESMHVKRYERYPDIEFYYDGEFGTIDGQKVFEEYIHRVFYQFYSKVVTVRPVEDFYKIGGYTE